MNLTGFDRVNFDLSYEDRCRAHNLAAILKEETNADSPLLSDVLAPRIGVTGKRAGIIFRGIVSYMRGELHLPVGSGAKGYFWARTRQELQPTIDHIQQRAVKEHAVVAGLEKAFPPEEQGRLL